jgi:hypothetical protein
VLLLLLLESDQHCAGSLLNMSTEGESLKTLLEEAAGIVVVSNHKVGIRKAMELVGISDALIKTMKWYQKVLVRRRATKLCVVEEGGKAKKITPPAVEVNLACLTSQVSALSSEGISRRRQRDSLSGEERTQRSVRRRILNTPSTTSDSNGSSKSMTPPDSLLVLLAKAVVDTPMKKLEDHPKNFNETMP